MPARFEVLARWNAERARGLVHMPEREAKMAELQREFDAWACERAPGHVAGGSVPAPPRGGRENREMMR